MELTGKQARKQVLASLKKQAGVAMGVDLTTLLGLCGASGSAANRLALAVEELVARGRLWERKVYGTKVYGLD